MSMHNLILATDLDGTFLGGSDAQRRELYNHLSARGDALLIFVSGRDIDFIRELVRTPGMPHPDYVIGDVGTTVVQGRDFVPMPEVQAEISERWGDAGDRVKALLADEPGIKLQPTPFERRVSYYYDPAVLRRETLEKIEQAGFDWLLSAETFLDVLPKGIAKGPTLLRLVEALKLPADRVLVAGDTLNDLSLFETRLKGVAVGNSEPKLVQAIDGFDWVYRSPHPGAAGIADAIRHFDMSREAA
ncbi:HAD-IIB family hydrolase [Oceanibaculum pacificum]|uniref:Alpha,alpha-trehalose-phosphate synthase n=1 Tax=Oceanibaculum pacificum TaxID=580166 RepID=A0A154WGT6_9PROT|nr:HAD-IIB family hydrolase [Oceanibaculum pacificum]KZD12675.1 alpha,alpha-trehalose-phosphate synthase [Oceanibaculum pacificum]